MIHLSCFSFQFNADDAGTVFHDLQADALVQLPRFRQALSIVRNLQAQCTAIVSQAQHGFGGAGTLTALLIASCAMPRRWLATY
jgi:hypothetical protein